MSALPTSLPPPLPFLPSKLRLLFRECTAIFYAPSHIIPHTRSSLHRWRSSSGFLKFCRNKIGEQGTVSTKGFYRFPRQSGTTSRSEVGLVIAIGKKKSCAKNPRLIPHPVSLTGFGVGVVSHRGHLKREEIRGPARDLSDSNPSFLPSFAKDKVGDGPRAADQQQLDPILDDSHLFRFLFWSHTFRLDNFLFRPRASK